MRQTNNPNDKLDPRRWMALVILLTGAFLPPLDFFIVNVALPSIRDDFHASASTMQLIISGYATTYAVMLVTGGRLGDLYGRRNVFLAGMISFAAASALCGFATSPSMLIVGRVLQGFAAAIMAPQALASINAIFPDHEKSKALTFYALTFGLASMAGLILGGALIALDVLGLGWRAIFLINLPVIAVAAPSAYVMLRETRSEHPSKLDLGGALLLALALLALVAPLIEGREQGWPTWSILMLVASLPLLFLFWYYEQKVEGAGRDPIVAPALLQNAGLVRGLLAALFFYALAAFWLIFSVYQQGGLGRTPLEAGLAILPAAVGFVLGPLASERILRVFGRFSAGAGMAVQAIGLLATAVLILSDLSPFLFVALFLIGAGQGIALPNLVKSVVQRVDKTQSGLASGLINSVLQIGGALAVAIVGGLFFSILGSATDTQSIGQAYSVAAIAIAICLLVAGWLSTSLASTKPSRPRARATPTQGLVGGSSGDVANFRSETDTLRSTPMHNFPSLPLAGKRALVTGAARGIGAAIALKLAEDGADVAITYEKSAEKAEALAAEMRAVGRRAIAIQADAASSEAATTTVARTVSELGGLDILVNNAGVLFASDFSTQPLEEIDLQLNVNIRGVFLITQAALKHIPNGGRIISTGSNAGLAVPFAGIAVYAATKSALESFTRGLARELGSRDITVNLVRPGPIDTDMNPADGALAPAILPSLSIARYGKAREVAEAVAFLAGPGAAYITGSGILVDGGISA